MIPGDERWPAGLDDLPDAPYGLWYVRNIAQGLPAVQRAAALTGSRDSTSYGAAVTGEMAHGLAQRGICIVSGLAYGVDAHAHRGALAGFTGGGPATIAVATGGLDRVYPSGNADLAAAIRANGSIVSEQPRAARPRVTAFLQQKLQMYAFATTQREKQEAPARTPSRGFISSA